MAGVRVDNSGLPVQAQRSAINQPLRQQRFSHRHTRLERVPDFFAGQFSHALRDQSVLQIAVRSETAGWDANNIRMSRQINRIGDDGRGRIGRRSASGQDRHCIGDTQREAAPAPTAGGNPSNWLR